MARYKFDTAHEWLEDYLTRNPSQAHSIAMTLAMKLDSDSIQDEFQSDMDMDGYFDDLDEQDEDESDEQGYALTPVIAILTAFTVAAVLIAQSGLLHKICARLAEVAR